MWLGYLFPAKVCGTLSLVHPFDLIGLPSGPGAVCSSSGATMASRAMGKLICSLINVCFCHFLSGFPEKEEHRVGSICVPIAFISFAPTVPLGPRTSACYLCARLQMGREKDKVGQ